MTSIAPPRIFLDEDGDGEPTIWLTNPDRPDLPIALLRKCDLPVPARLVLWPVLVAEATK